MTVIDQIKQGINCLELCNKLGIALDENNRRKSFRKNADNPTSLSIKEDGFYDFGINEGGDVIKLYQQFKGITVKQAVRDLAQMLGIGGADYIGDKQINMIIGKSRNIKNELKEIVEIWNKALLGNNKIMSALKDKRGITEETVKKFKIGYATNIFSEEKFKTAIEELALNNLYERLIFPFIDEQGDIISLTGRYTKKNQSIPYMKTKGSPKGLLWGVDTIQEDCRELWIAEGMFDALTLAQEGKQVITSSSTAFGDAERREKLISLISEKTTVYICMDYDQNETQAGQVAAKKIAKFLWNNRINANIVTLDIGDSESHDISELYSKHGNLDFITSSMIRTYSDMLFEKEQEESQEIVSYICRHNSPAKQIRYKRELSQHIDKEVAKEMFKEGNKIPSEVFIINKLKEKFERKRFGAMGWYQYNKKEGVWRKSDADFIKSSIKTESGAKATGSRIGSIYKNYEVDENILLRPSDMNKSQHLFNVKNGMIDLNTKELLPHNKDEYSTMQADFPFHITTDYSFAENFLKTISNDDQTMVQYLMDVMGELLIPDNRFHVAHFHIGKGRNGKSVFLDILQHMAGEHSRTTVPLYDFNKDNKIIHLKDSILNIATENHSHDPDCESRFKQLIAGEEIEACYKYKDYVQFKTRAKFHFAMNSLPKIYDKSDGVADRMRIAMYDIKFVDNPVKPNERKKILNYIQDLRENVNQFLNIAIDARKALLQRGFITETSQHKDIMGKIIARANPIREFVKELPLGFDKRSITRLYDDYKIWVKENGHRTVSKNSFQENLGTIDSIQIEGEFVDVSLAIKEQRAII